MVTLQTKADIEDWFAWYAWRDVWRAIGDAYFADNGCLDCGGLLIPCTCQPDCPGGMCPRCRAAPRGEGEAG